MFNLNNNFNKCIYTLIFLSFFCFGFATEYTINSENNNQDYTLSDGDVLKVMSGVILTGNITGSDSSVIICNYKNEQEGCTDGNKINGNIDTKILLLVTPGDNNSSKLSDFFINENPTLKLGELFATPADNTNKFIIDRDIIFDKNGTNDWYFLQNGKFMSYTELMPSNWLGYGGGLNSGREANIFVLKEFDINSNITNSKGEYINIALVLVKNTNHKLNINNELNKVNIFLDNPNNTYKYEINLNKKITGSIDGRMVSYDKNYHKIITVDSLSAWENWVVYGLNLNIKSTSNITKINGNYEINNNSEEKLVLKGINILDTQNVDNFTIEGFDTTTKEHQSFVENIYSKNLTLNNVKFTNETDKRKMDVIEVSDEITLQGETKIITNTLNAKSINLDINLSQNNLSDVLKVSKIDITNLNVNKDFTIDTNLNYAKIPTVNISDNKNLTVNLGGNFKANIIGNNATLTIENGNQITGDVNIKNLNNNTTANTLKDIIDGNVTINNDFNLNSDFTINSNFNVQNVNMMDSNKNITISKTLTGNVNGNNDDSTNLIIEEDGKILGNITHINDLTVKNTSNHTKLSELFSEDNNNFDVKNDVIIYEQDNGTNVDKNFEIDKDLTHNIDFNGKNLTISKTLTGNVNASNSILEINENGKVDGDANVKELTASGTSFTKSSDIKNVITGNLTADTFNVNNNFEVDNNINIKNINVTSGELTISTDVVGATYNINDNTKLIVSTDLSGNIKANGNADITINDNSKINGNLDITNNLTLRNNNTNYNNFSTLIADNNIDKNKLNEFYSNTDNFTIDVDYYNNECTTDYNKCTNVYTSDGNKLNISGKVHGIISGSGKFKDHTYTFGDDEVILNDGAKIYHINSVKTVVNNTNASKMSELIESQATMKEFILKGDVKEFTFDTKNVGIESFIINGEKKINITNPIYGSITGDDTELVIDKSVNSNASIGSMNDSDDIKVKKIVLKDNNNSNSLKDYFLAESANVTTDEIDLSNIKGNNFTINRNLKLKSDGTGNLSYNTAGKTLILSSELIGNINSDIADVNDAKIVLELSDGGKVIGNATVKELTTTGTSFTKSSDIKNVITGNLVASQLNVNNDFEVDNAENINISTYNILDNHNLIISTELGTNENNVTINGNKSILTLNDSSVINGNVNIKELTLTNNNTSKEKMSELITGNINYNTFDTFNSNTNFEIDSETNVSNIKNINIDSNKTLTISKNFNTENINGDNSTLIVGNNTTITGNVNVKKLTNNNTSATKLSDIINGNLIIGDDNGLNLDNLTSSNFTVNKSLIAKKIKIGNTEVIIDSNYTGNIEGNNNSKLTINDNKTIIGDISSLNELIMKNGIIKGNVNSNAITINNTNPNLSSIITGDIISNGVALTRAVNMDKSYHNAKFITNNDVNINNNIAVKALDMTGGNLNIGNKKLTLNDSSNISNTNLHISINSDSDFGQLLGNSITFNNTDILTLNLNGTLGLNVGDSKIFKLFDVDSSTLQLSGYDTSLFEITSNDSGEYTITLLKKVVLEPNTNPNPDSAIAFTFDNKLLQLTLANKGDMNIYNVLNFWLDTDNPTSELQRTLLLTLYTYYDSDNGKALVDIAKSISPEDPNGDKLRVMAINSRIYNAVSDRFTNNTINNNNRNTNISYNNNDNNNKNNIRYSNYYSNSNSNNNKLISSYLIDYNSLIASNEDVRILRNNANRLNYNNYNNNNNNNNLWVNYLYINSELDKNDKSKYKTNGIILGYDHSFFNNKLTLGLSYAYTGSDTSISEYSLSKNTTTHNAILYGNYNFYNNFFINFTGIYGLSKNEEDRYVLNRKYSYDYNSKTLGLQSKIGYNWFITKNNILTPSVGARYLNINKDKYKDMLNQEFKSKISNVTSGIAGIQYKSIFKNKNNSLFITPRLNADFVYNNSSKDKMDVILGYRSYKLNYDEIESTNVEIGAGIDISYKNTFTFSADYQRMIIKDFEDNSFSLKLGFEF